MGWMIATRIALGRLELVRKLTICSSGYYVSKEARDIFAKSADPQMIDASNSEWAVFYRQIHKEDGPIIGSYF